MNILKVLYFFNVIFILNLLVPCLCHEESALKELQLLEEDELLKNQKKKKNIIIYSSVAIATAILLAALGTGIHYRNKRKRIEFWRDERFAPIIKKFTDEMEKSTESIGDDFKNYSFKEMKNVFKKAIKVADPENELGRIRRDEAVDLWARFIYSQAHLDDIPR